MRNATISRRSSETEIEISVGLDGNGACSITTPFAFFTHMLEALGIHGHLDLKISVQGDIEVDQHHTLEDTGFVLGGTILKALGDRRGINRTGFFAFPMDDSLGIVSLDFSGRPHAVVDMKFTRPNVGGVDVEALREFFRGFSRGANCSLVLAVPIGEDNHHKIESVFKAFGKAIWMAVSRDDRLKDFVPSTKKMLD